VGKDVLWGNNIAIQRSAIVKVGAFDERFGAGSNFPSSEDNDLGFRLLEAGYRIIYMPKATLYHRAWRINKSMFR
jgi:GT2 family glycosyltransferase